MKSLNAKRNWIRTDDLQFVHKENEDQFLVIETTFFPDQKIYVVQEREIDLKDYNDRQLDKLAYGYYDSLAHLKEESGEHWKQYMAEIIAELDQIDEEDLNFSNRKDLFEHLQNEYDIEPFPEDLIEYED